ncbi:hypothetical protein [Leclercia sp.]|uniref:hypothetical protein n=1 Tax=Leclercia sp. TaxID=1898428 RepID=UPI0028A8C0ED|nr:hypothetical protein [Leclercia sp.]
MKIKELRARVLASLVDMDETPAPPPPTPAEISASVEAFWRKVENNPPTGRRQKVKGRETDGSNDRPAVSSGLTATLRAIADFRKVGGMLQIRYHGEHWQNLDDEIPYLRTLLPDGMLPGRIRNAVSAIAD